MLTVLTFYFLHSQHQHLQQQPPSNITLSHGTNSNSTQNTSTYSTTTCQQHSQHLLIPTKQQHQRIYILTERTAPRRLKGTVSREMFAN